MSFLIYLEIVISLKHVENISKTRGNLHILYGSMYFHVWSMYVENRIYVHEGENVQNTTSTVFPSQLFVCNAKTHCALFDLIITANNRPCCKSHRKCVSIECIGHMFGSKYFSVNRFIYSTSCMHSTFSLSNKRISHLIFRCYFVYGIFLFLFKCFDIICSCVTINNWNGSVAEHSFWINKLHGVKCNGKLKTTFHAQLISHALFNLAGCWF